MKTVILAAGFGSRLWPLSTSDQPKQFQMLLNDTTLLQHTYSLLSQVIEPEDLYVVTLSGLEDMVYDQLPQIRSQNVITVPDRRNTLPHTAFALNSINLSQNEPVLFCPVDHFMVHPKRFVTDLKDIVDSFPEQTDKSTILCSPAASLDPSLGYIQADESGKVTKFVEKPSLESIKSLQKSNNLYQNTMRFITSKAAFLTGLSSLDKSLSSKVTAIVTSSKKDLNENLLSAPVADLREFWINSDNLFVKDAESEFVDIGKFDTLYEVNDKDKHRNVVKGKVVLDELSHDNFIVNQTNHLLTVIDAHDSVIVQTDRGTLVSSMHHVSDVGEIYKTKIDGIKLPRHQ